MSEGYANQFVFEQDIGSYQVDFYSKRTGFRQGGLHFEGKAGFIIPGDAIESEDFKLTEKGFEAFNVQFEVMEGGRKIRKATDP